MHWGLGEKITKDSTGPPPRPRAASRASSATSSRACPIASLRRRVRGRGRARLRRLRLPLRHGDRGAYGGARPLHRGARRHLLRYFTNFKGDEGLYLGLSGTDDGFFYELMQRVARYPQALLAVHPENIELVRRAPLKFQSEGRATLKDWSLAKPPITEAADTLRAMYYAEQTGCPIYFVHASAKLALDEIAHFRRRYPRIHVETCPNISPTRSSPTQAPSARRTRPFARRRTWQPSGRAWPTAPSRSWVRITSRASARPRRRTSGRPPRASRGRRPSSRSS